MSINGCSPHPASWAELWDRADAVSAHTLKGVEFLEKIGTYAKERAQIEEEYASKLRNLAKKTLGKKKEDEEAIKSFTYVRAFYNLLRELEALAGQHEMIGEKLRGEVCQLAVAKSNQFRANRKTCLLDLQNINSNLNSALDHMNKQQRSYGKAFKEAEAAFGKYYKAEKNMEISRLDLEKAKNNAHMRNQMSEEAKASYAHALQGANDAQDQHYGRFLPDCLDKLRALDLERIADTQTVMEMCINAEVKVHSIIARCHEDMRKHAELIDAAHDSSMVVEQNKTGYLRPPPFQFEDHGNPDGTSSGNHSTFFRLFSSFRFLALGSESIDSTLKRGMIVGPRKDSKSVVRNKSMKLFGGGEKYKSDGNSDYGQLPPHQRIKKLEEKIEGLSTEREKAMKEKEGCIRLQQAYRSNPKLGNAADCDQLLTKHNKEIESLTTQINKFRVMLEDVQSQTNIPLGSIIDTPPSVRSGSSASSAPKQPHSNGRSSVSEESITSIDNPRGDHKIENPTHKRDETYANCDLPVLGTAIVQFSYDGGTEGTMIIKEGQELLLIEKDEGDGWTRVRTRSGDVEGFVPSSYLKCNWYPND